MLSKDLLFKDQRIIVFVNDCFWYRHEDCPAESAYREAPAFWKARAERIRRRNMDTFKKLTLRGWTVITAWSCQNEEETLTGTPRRHYLTEYLLASIKETTRLLLLLTR